MYDQKKNLYIYRCSLKLVRIGISGSVVSGSVASPLQMIKGVRSAKNAVEVSAARRRKWPRVSQAEVNIKCGFY